MKKELKKSDCIFIGMIIGILIMSSMLVIDTIETKNDCAINNNHNYVTRCTKCGDILSESEKGIIDEHRTTCEPDTTKNP